MAYWEFLLQKEGDRSWLPLESPDVEILEGRYRVVARSSRINAPVEIRISHLSDEMQPKRRSQKRMGQTNQDGLVVVIPFTCLQPGSWELRCTNDLMADLMGDSWQYAVQLQVLPQDSDLAGDWETDWLRPVASVAQGTEASQEDSALLIAPLPSPLAEPVSLTAMSEIASVHAESGENSREKATGQDAADAATSSPSPKATADTVDEHSGSTPESTDTELNRVVGLQGPLQEGVFPESPQTFTASPAPETITFAAPTDPAQLRELAEQLSQQVIDDTFQDFDRDLAIEAVQSSQPDRTAEETPLLEPLCLAGQPLQLRLQAETYVTRLGRPIQLSGQLLLEGDSSEVEDSAIHPAATLPDSELQIRLFDPQTSQLLAETHHALPAQPLPVSFQLAVDVPPSHRTHLILGEVLLTASLDGTPKTVAPQPFTITADFNDLLEAIADEEEVVEAARQAASMESNAEPSPSDESPSAAASKRNLAFVDFQTIPKQVSSFQPSIGMTMPPRLERQSSAAQEESRRSPQLPIIPPPPLPLPETEAAMDGADEIAQAERVTPDLESPTSLETGLEDSAVELEVVDPKAGDPSSQLAEAISPVTPGLSLGRTPTTDEVEPPPEPLLADEDFAVLSPWEAHPVEWAHQPQDVLSPLDLAFQSLNLQDRFWSRLSALAADPDRSTWLDDQARSQSSGPLEAKRVDASSRQSSGEATTWISAHAAKTPSAQEHFAPSQPFTSDHVDLPETPGTVASDAELTAHEIVIYSDIDSDVIEATPAEAATRSTETDQPKPPAAPAAEVSELGSFSELESVPAPLIEIPDGDLVAGEMITLTVQLPNLVMRTYVKYWVSDRQTRSLLDGPHWLIDFSPNGLNQQEVQTQLTVPHGCLELQLEAVAVEVATQRQSPKVSLSRTVVPPDLPVFSFDEFEL